MSRLNPKTWTRKTWDRLALVLAGLLGAAAVLFWLPAEARAALNPWNWDLPQWVATVLLILIVTGLVGLHGSIAAMNERLDQSWDEVDSLRSEVGSLKEHLYQATIARLMPTPPAETHVLVVPQEAVPVVEPVTDPLGTAVVAAPAKPSPRKRVPGEPVPTTVTGLPTARPRVPETGATRYDPEHVQERPRGRHAARD